MTALESIVAWNQSRNLHDYKASTEAILLLRELEELLVNMIQGQDPVDDLCDIIVVATGSLHKLGYDPEKAMLETYKEISSRQGTVDLSTGKWEKDRNQDPSTLYKANYDACRKPA